MYLSYKREAYRGSEFGARILADNDIPVVMKVRFHFVCTRTLLIDIQV